MCAMCVSMHNTLCMLCVYVCIICMYAMCVCMHNIYVCYVCMYEAHMQRAALLSVPNHTDRMYLVSTRPTEYPNCIYYNLQPTQQGLLQSEYLCLLSTHLEFFPSHNVVEELPSWTELLKTAIQCHTTHIQLLHHTPQLPVHTPTATPSQPHPPTHLQDKVIHSLGFNHLEELADVLVVKTLKHSDLTCCSWEIVLHTRGQEMERHDMNVDP